VENRARSSAWLDFLHIAVYNLRVDWEYVDTDWNPTTGCSPISPACDNCRARKIANRLRGRYGYRRGKDPFDVELRGGRLREPSLWRDSRMIRVCRLGDLFHSCVPTEYIRRVFKVARACPQHVFRICTKRPERLQEFGYFYPELTNAPNIWLGVTVEDWKRLKRIWPLINTPASVRYVSCEPLLDRLFLNYDSLTYCRDCREVNQRDLRRAALRSELRERCQSCGSENVAFRSYLHYLDWVICGGEKEIWTGRRVQTGWAIGLMRQCKRAGVPFYFTQGTASKAPRELQVKQWPKSHE
jgi:protein gp37